MGHGLTQDEIAVVLRRAAELDRSIGSPGHDEGLDEAAVVQAAVEAGISGPAVRRALAEYRAGVLDERNASEPPRWRLGPAVLHLCRTVPGPAHDVQYRLHRFLGDQLFELRRDQGSRTTWVRRKGLEATTRRAIDRALRRRLILRDANHVVVSVVDQEEGWVLVRLEVDVLNARHAQSAVAGSASVAGTGVTAITAAAAGIHPAFLIVAGASAGVVCGGHMAGAAIYRRRVSEVESGLAGMLDRLERSPHGPRRGVSA